MASAVSNAGLPTYKLVFNAGTQLHGATAPFLWLPSDAACELFLFFKNASSIIFPDRPTDVNNVTLASVMKDWFISFVTDLDPNAHSYSNVSKPEWPMYNPEMGTSDVVPEFAIMDVNYTMMGVIPDIDVKPRCDFFHASSYTVRN